MLSVKCTCRPHNNPGFAICRETQRPHQKLNGLICPLCLSPHESVDGALYKQLVLAPDTQNKQCIHHGYLYSAVIICLWSHFAATALYLKFPCVGGSHKIFGFLSSDQAFNVPILHRWHREWLFVMFSVALSFGQLTSPVYIIPFQNLPMSNNGFRVFLSYFWARRAGNMMLWPSSTFSLFSLTIVWNLIVFWQLFPWLAQL